MMRLPLFVSTVLVLCSLVFAQQDHPERLKFLPGYPHMLPTPWYSGYVSYTLNETTIHTHYVLVEAEGKTKDTPLIYWSNGGPGASSLFGLLAELGPLVLSDLSLKTRDYEETGIPTPLYNPFGWSKLGSILIFDQPAPVGFSYCNDDLDGKGDSCLAWTDELASQNTFLALHAFYDKFPEYKPKPLYLTGESYAGIYIPTCKNRHCDCICSYVRALPLF
jgi:carboxypeptidase C (cathepsin A)